MATRILLQGVRRELVSAAFRQFFGIGQERANLLVTLYVAQGDHVKLSEVQRGVDSHRRPTSGAIWESIRILRTIMDVEAIDTSPDGYCLTEVGLAECRAALLDAAQALTAAPHGAPIAEPVLSRPTMVAS